MTARDERDVGPVGAARWWSQVDAMLDGGAWPVVRAWKLALPFPRAASAWFVRKPPGLRLRAPAFDSRDAAQSCALQVDALARVGVQARPAIYEPELHRFGGVEGTNVAHAILAASTAAWLSWRQARRDQAAAIEPVVVALAIYDDLVRRVTGDRPEQWDVWCSLASLYFGVRATPGFGGSTGLDLRGVCDAGSAGERELIAAAFDDNARAAAAFAQLRRDGTIRIGPRAFVVTLATFHWNVWGIPRHALRRALTLMIHELDPVPASSCP